MPGGPLLGHGPPRVKLGGVHHPWGPPILHPHRPGAQTPASQTPHAHSSLPPASQRSPQPFFIHLPRFLLTAVALLSSYSIHLLLKSSGVVGEPPASL